MFSPDPAAGRRVDLCAPRRELEACLVRARRELRIFLFMSR
jgi:hypothetical protein